MIEFSKKALGVKHLVSLTAKNTEGSEGTYDW